MEPHKNSSTERGPRRKRVRHSGHSYCTYLTDRASLEYAPTYIQKQISEHVCPEKDGPNATSSNQTPPQNNTDQEPIGIEEIRFLPLETIETYTGNYDSIYSSDSNADSNYYESDSCQSESSQNTSDTENDEIQDDDQDNEDNFKDIPIYDGARLTTGASMLLIMTFVLEHNLTGSAFSDLLNLISLHCKENNTIPSSMHLFKQCFQNLELTPKKHIYCSSCLLSIEDSSLERCPNPKCRHSFYEKSSQSFFVEIPLEDQIQKLFKNKTFREKLKFRFQRIKKNNSAIEDIYDGSQYKKFEDILSNLNNFSMTWNTDGIPLFKSSKTSMWPLYFSINELPFKLRRNPENLLLAGLWIGPKKPEMMTFLKPFINSLEHLENGIVVQTDEESDITVKGILIAGTADLPAKCAVCNMMQFNGQYSCPCCKQPGQSAAAGKGRCQIFPFDFENPVGPPRTHVESLQNAEEALQSGKTVYGIKGPCWLTNIGTYDFVIGNCTDYMHCVLLGVTKLLISLWFLKKSPGKAFDVSEKINFVDERLKSIKPHLDIRRRPRSLNELKYWKASEFKSWLIYYAPVVLQDVLPREHYEHFLLFSNGIRILLMDSISEDDLLCAENFLEHFVARFAELYEERFLTLNMHLLLHLSTNVRNFGPLWVYSCFPFEDANGYLLKLVKGTQSVESQIIDSISIVHGLPYLRQSCIAPGSEESEFLEKMCNESMQGTHRLQDDLYALGKLTYVKVEKLANDYYVAIANYLNRPPDGSFRVFNRLKKSNKVFHSLNYTRVRVRNSYAIKFTSVLGEDSYGLVKCFIYFEPTDGERATVFAIILPLTPNCEEHNKFPHDDVTEQPLMTHINIMNTPNLSSQAKAINAKNISNLCVMISFKEKDVCYLSTAPNSLEKD